MPGESHSDIKVYVVKTKCILRPGDENSLDFPYFPSLLAAFNLYAFACFFRPDQINM